MVDLAGATTTVAERQSKPTGSTSIATRTARGSCPIAAWIASVALRRCSRDVLRSMMRKRKRLRTFAIGAGVGPSTVDARRLAAARRLARGAREERRRLLRLLLVERVDAHERHARERRIRELLAIAQLALDEAVHVVLRART